MTQFNDDDDDLDLPPRRVFRLVPLTMMMASLLLVIKVNELYIGSQQLSELYSARDATAAEPDVKKEGDKPADAKPADAKKDDATKDDKAAADVKKDDAKPADAKDDAKKDDAKPEEGKKDDAKPADAKKDDAKKEEGKEGEKKPPEDPKTYGTGKSTVKQIEALKERAGDQRFSQNEIDLLQNLAKRREELDAREKELDLKAKVLDATQKRIDDKMGEMKELDAKLTKTLEAYNEKQNAQIGSLVKIYENMKPSQAAAIFNELDLPILLEVIDKMSERKVSPVLALMDPKKARDVTQELAAMRKSSPKAAAAKK